MHYLTQQSQFNTMSSFFNCFYNLHLKIKVEVESVAANQISNVKCNQIMINSHEGLNGILQTLWSGQHLFFALYIVFSHTKPKRENSSVHHINRPTTTINAWLIQGILILILFLCSLRLNFH